MPFLRNSLLSGVLFAAVLFGGYEVSRRMTARAGSQPRLGAKTLRPFPRLHQKDVAEDDAGDLALRQFTRQPLDLPFVDALRIASATP